jgi:hypothetical protein
MCCCVHCLEQEVLSKWAEMLLLPLVTRLVNDPSSK